MKTLHRYIGWELLKTTFLSLGLFIFIILMDRASFIAQTVLGKGISFLDFLSVLLKTVPSFLGIVIPISFVISTLITYINLEQNNEIVAMKACGINLKEISKSTVYLGILFSLLSFFLLMYVAPKSNVEAKREIEELLRKKITMSITPNSFSSNLPGITFYAQEVFPKKGYILNFMASIEKKNKMITIFGKEGALRSQNNTVYLDILNGSAQIVNWSKPKDFKYLKFKSYTIELYKFNQKEKFKAVKYKTFSELLKIKGAEAETEILKRLSLALAPLIVGLLAFSIAVSLPRGSLGTGILSGLLIIVGYYIIYTFSKKFAVKMETPLLALTPDVIFGALALFLYRQVIKEKIRIEIGGRW